MYHTPDEAYNIDSLGLLSKEELKTKINKSCEQAWKHYNQVRIMFVTADEEGFPKNIYVKIFNKDTPNKMQSKKMSAKKSTVKRMTGDIGQLGKNFRKLI